MQTQHVLTSLVHAAPERRTARSRRFGAALGTLVLALTGIVAAGLPAHADPVTATSQHFTVTMSDDAVAQDGTLTLTAEIANEGTGAFPVFLTTNIDADPIRLAPGDVVESVSCSSPDMTVSACDLYPDEVIDVGGIHENPGGTATITITLEIAEDADLGLHDVTFQGEYGKSLETLTPLPVYLLVVEPAPTTTDLAVSLDASAGPLLTSQITYALDVTNDGPADVTSSRVDVALPPPTTSVSGLPVGCTYAAATDVVTCDTGAIANGATSSGTFRANLGLLSVGPLDATAVRVQSLPVDPNPSNDESTASCAALTSLLISCP